MKKKEKKVRTNCMRISAKNVCKLNENENEQDII